METYNFPIPLQGRDKRIHSKVSGCYDGVLLLYAMSSGFQAFRLRLHTVSVKRHSLQLQSIASPQASSSLSAKHTQLARRFSWSWQRNAECRMNAQCSGSQAVGHNSSSNLNGMISNCGEALTQAASRRTTQDSAVKESPLKRGLEDGSAGTRDAANTGHE